MKDNFFIVLCWFLPNVNTNTYIKDDGEVKWSCSVISNSLWTHGLYPTTFLCPWDLPGKSTGVGCHFLLQRIFLTQGSIPGLLHCRQMLYHVSLDILTWKDATIFLRGEKVREHRVYSSVVCVCVCVGGGGCACS